MHIFEILFQIFENLKPCIRDIIAYMFQFLKKWVSIELLAILETHRGREICCKGGIELLQNEEFIQEFVEEAEGHVEAIESGLLQMAQKKGDPGHINNLFRCVHSIKGTAGFFGLEKIVKLSHTMENLFGEIRNGRIQLNDYMIDVLLSANDYLRQMIKNVFESENMDIDQHVANITSIVKNAPLQEQNLPLGKNKEDETPKKNSSGIVLEDSIRVHINLLNDLMNLASELVLGRNQLLRALEDHHKSIPGIEPILQNVDRITTELQETIMQTRMQPLGNVFNKFPRLIRELSRKTKKDIRLEMSGTDVELDKSIIESLADPLTHLIRNAVDHGIEPASERLKAEKEEVGLISLKAYHEGGHVIIDIMDDGQGMDEEKIRQKAVEKGLIQAEEAAEMRDEEILQMIFLPGFSTSSTVTDMSGRGVGMDVVKTNIEKMGGTIEIFTQKGRGTTFRLNLPLTLAIISSIIVEVKGQKFALPQVNLQEIVRIKPGDSERRIEYANGVRVLRLRNRLLPLISLSEILGLHEEKVHESRLSTIIRVLVLKIGSKRFGLIVDAIHDGEEILVKPLPSYLKDCKAYSGVTILGDGSIAMILDPEGIIAVSGLKFTDELVEDSGESDISDAYEGKREPILLFKCSGHEVFGLSLSMISRVEEICREDIQTIGDKEYIKYRYRTLRIIRPEDYLPVNKRDSDSQKLYVLVAKNTDSPIGILVEKIYDTILISAEQSRENIKARGIMGTAFWNNTIVLLLDLSELFELAAPKLCDKAAADLSAN